MCIKCPTERLCVSMYVYVCVCVCVCIYIYIYIYNAVTVFVSVFRTVQSIVRAPARTRKCSALRNVQPGSGATQPLFEGYRGSSLVLNWPGNKVNRSPPSSADFKHEWSCTSAPLYAFITWTEKTLPLCIKLAAP